MSRAVCRSQSDVGCIAGTRLDARDILMMTFSNSTTRKNMKPPRIKLWPNPKRYGLGVEQRLERRRISKKQLQHYDGADAQRQVLVAEVRLERQ